MKKRGTFFLLLILLLWTMAVTVSAAPMQLHVSYDGDYKGLYKGGVFAEEQMFVSIDLAKMLGYEIQQNTDGAYLFIDPKGNKTGTLMIPNNAGINEDFYSDGGYTYVSVKKLAGVLKAAYELQSGTGVAFYSSNEKKSQMHFAAALIKMKYVERFKSLRTKTDGINEECEKLDRGGELNAKKLTAQFEAVIKASKSMRKDIAKIKAEDSKMKYAKDMLISGYELLESAMKDLRKVTETKDLEIFQTYRMKVKKANSYYSDGWAIITEGLK